MNLANGYAVNLTDVSPKIDDRPADRRPLTTDRKGGNIFSAVGGLLLGTSTSGLN
ncbi:MAG: hypothetical protein H6633_31260 [Anaerolineales bacterium]|nr:hypothetical protein [Anaerolineales bacterium]